MYFKAYYPAKFYTKYIDSYFVIDTSLLQGDITDLVVPDGTFGLLFTDTQKNIRRNLNITDPPVSLVKTSVFGQKTKPVNYYYSKGNTKSFGVKINPAGLSLFLNESLNQIKNIFVDIDVLGNRKLLELEAKVLNAQTVHEKIKSVEDYVLSGLNRLHTHPDYILFSSVIAFIQSKKGEIRLGAITDHFNINYKKVERLFNFYLGISSKTYIRIVRFNAILYLRNELKGSSLTQLGNELGFFDQSHFIREFKSLSSLSPKNFFNKKCSLSEKTHLEIISRRWEDR